jgi:hypothetical protein
MHSLRSRGRVGIISQAIHRDYRDAENQIASYTSGCAHHSLTGQAKLLAIADTWRHGHGHRASARQIDYATPAEPRLLLTYRKRSANILRL